MKLGNHIYFKSQFMMHMCAFPLISFTQNLFPNPQFDHFIHCPTDYNQVNEVEAYTTLKATPDFFHCAFEGFEIFQGNSDSQTGVVGLIAGANHPACPESAYTELITAKLTQKLEGGKPYTVYAKVKLNEKGTNSNGPNPCMNLGFYFYLQTNPFLPWRADNCCEDVSPQISFSGEIVSVGDYVTLSGTFIPEKLVDHVVIGPFCNTLTSSLQCKNYQQNIMYFNLDEISLTQELPLNPSFSFFKGIHVNGQNKLFWSLESNLPSNYFYIQRWSETANQEVDTSISFDTIGQVSSKRPSSLHPFEFIDKHPLEGTNIYRIKWYDQNGQLHISHQLAVFASINRVFQLFMNPNNGHLIITYAEPKPLTIHVSLRSVTGKSILQTEMNIEAGEHILPLSLNNKPSGIYFIQIQDERGNMLLNTRWPNF